MKILYIVTGLGIGGAEHIVCNLADKAKEYAHEVKIVYLTGQASILPSNGNIEIIDLNLKKNIYLFKGLWRLRLLIKKYQPDVIHSHMVHANLVARLSRLWIKLPKLICTAHNSNEGGRLLMVSYRVTNFLCDVFTNVSDEASRALEASGAAPKNSIIPVLNGIDIDKFSYIQKAKNDVFTLVAVGRLEEQKDYPTLLTALSFLQKKGISFRLRVVGDGSQRNNLLEMTQKLCLLDSIEWLGARRDVSNILNEADCFVLSSEFEGFGLVVAEAMACELPVVATDCGGVKEVLGEQHWLVKPKDAYGLSEKIVEIMSMTEDQRKSLGKQHRRRVEKFYSLDSMYKNYERLYKN